MNTIHEVVGFLKSNGTNCRFCSIVSETQPKLKPGCPFKGVLKVSRKFGMINANYVNSVRRRVAEKLGVEAKEVEYENGEVWYRHLQTNDGKDLPLVVNKKTSHSGEYYLQYFPLASENVYRMPTGNIVPKEKLEKWIYRQTEKPDYKPAVISIKVSNIKELRASGVIVQAEDLDAAGKALNAFENEDFFKAN